MNQTSVSHCKFTTNPNQLARPLKECTFAYIKRYLFWDIGKSNGCNNWLKLIRIKLSFR